MKREYQYIIGKLLLRYRKEHQLTQREIAKKLDISYCQISRMEQGKRSITDQNAELILDRLNIDLSANEDELDRYNELFDKLYISIANFDDPCTYDLHGRLEDLKENICKTILQFKYALYEFIYCVDLRIDFETVNLIDLLSYDDLFIERDRQTLYDYASVYFRRQGDFNKAIELGKIAVDISGETLNYAISCSHYARSLINNCEFTEAKFRLNEANKIFKKHNINKRLASCEILTGILHIETKELSLAEDVFIDIVNSDTTSKENIKVVIANLLWVYSLSKQYARALHLIEFLNENEDLTNKKAITNIIYLSFLNNDIMLFAHWYDLFAKTYKDSDIDEMVVNVIGAWFRFDKDATLKLHEKAMRTIKLPEDKDEYLMINEVLAETYIRLNDYQKASEIYKKLYFIEHGDLNRTSFDE